MLKFSETSLSKRLGLRHPIMHAPLGDSKAAPDMIALIGKTGGLGCLGAKDLSCGEMIAAVGAIQAVTSAPYAVHLSRFDDNPDFLLKVETLLELKAPVLCLEGALPPEAILRKLRLQKTVLVGISATKKGLQTLMKGNLDFLLYLGTLNAIPFDKDHQALIPLFKNSSVPLIAACPSFNRTTLTQWLAIGAAGVQVGFPYNKRRQFLASVKETPRSMTPKVEPLSFIRI